MDPVSAAASVVALVDIAAKVSKTIVKYSLAVKNANEDITRLQAEIQSLDSLLDDAKQLYESHDQDDVTIGTSTIQHVATCKTQLMVLAKKLEPGSLSRFGARLGRDLTWPLKKNEVDRMIANLAKIKDNISLSMQVDESKLARSRHQAVSSCIGAVQEKLFSLPVAEGASFDSFSDQSNALCCHGTRIDLRQDIRNWLDDSNGTLIFLLYGMAGTGKSTVLRTMAYEFQNQHRLGATFFFKRGEGARGNASRFFTTIASQLMRNIPALGAHIQEACKANPDIHEKALVQQFHDLIKSPVVKCSSITQILVIIDALDECDEEAHVGSIIELLGSLEATTTHIRILISSRPEYSIRTSVRNLSMTTYVLQELSGDISHDIELYLRAELSCIRKSSAPELPSTWPEDKQIQMLTTQAGSLWIAAATMCRFIGDPRWDPEEQIERLLSYKGDNFSRLGLIYQPILDQLLAGLNPSQKLEMLDDFQHVVGTIVLLNDTLSINALSKLLEKSKRYITSRLSKLHSVLRVPADDDSPIQLLHLSFRDFLTGNEHKDMPHWIDSRQTHKRIGQQCLRLLSGATCLKQDILELGKPASERRAIEQHVIFAKLSPEIRYSCLYWVTHICDGDIRFIDYDSMYGFLKIKFLYWIEAVILLGCQSRIKPMLERLHESCQNNTAPGLKAFLADAIEFITASGSTCDLYPLQIYSSALTFHPKPSLIRSIFEHEIPAWVHQLPKASDLYSRTSTLNLAHASFVTFIALSPDNRQLASGFYDGSIKLRTTLTGRLENTLIGRGKGSINFIGYIRQGESLISCSYGHDNVVLVWHSTGHLQQVIEFTSIISYVSLSHHRCLLAICLEFEGARLWDFSADSDIPLSSIYRPASYAEFSNNDDLIALGLWDGVELFTTSEYMKIGHLGDKNISEQCTGIAFSPGDCLLAKLSFKSVQIWSLNSDLLESEFTGDYEYGKIFFQDSSSLICLPNFYTDKRSQVWDCVSKRLDHNHEVCRWPVALSQDRTQMASMNEDGLLTIVDPADACLGDSIRTVIEPRHDDDRTFGSEWLFLDDGKHIIYHDPCRIELYDLIERRQIYSICIPAASIADISISSDGQFLAAYTDHDGLFVRRTADPALSQIIHGPDGSGVAQAFVFSKNSRQLASYNDLCITLWTLSRQCIKRASSINSHTSNISPRDSQLQYIREDKDLVGINWDDRRVHIWHIASGKLTHRFELAPSSIYPVISSNHRNLLSSNADHNIEIRDLTDDFSLQILDVSVVDASLLLCSPSGEQIVIGTPRGLRSWDISTNREQWTVDLETPHVGAFSDDGKFVAILSRYRHGFLIDALTGKLLKVWNCATSNTIIQPHFSPDQQYLITDRGTIDLKSADTQSSKTEHIFCENGWIKVNEEDVLCLPALYHPTSTAACSKYIAMGFASGEIVVWDVESGSSRNLLYSSNQDKVASCLINSDLAAVTLDYPVVSSP